MADGTLNPPKNRRCVVCGREDEWDEDTGGWRIRVIDGERRAGNRFCLHEWDIAGTHRPVTE